MSTTRGRKPARRADEPAFASFFEREEQRLGRKRSRRRTIVLSVGVHLLLLAVFALFAVWQVDELWTPSVGVKIFSPAQLPESVRQLEQRPAGPPARPAAPPPTATPSPAATPAAGTR